MAAYGYSNVQDRAFVAFDRELDDGPWKDISTDAYDVAAKQDAAVLLTAPQLVVWKIRLRQGIAGVLAALGAPSVAIADVAWDSAQRRLFHRVAVGVDDEHPAVRDAADRLREGLLAGTGTAQTQFDYDAEIDFGRQQMALTRPGGTLEAPAKKLKLADALADVEKTTEALAQALGRGTGEKRKSPSRKLRDAVAECASSFNAVHDALNWFIAHTPSGAERDRLEALLEPLNGLLARHAPKTPSPESAPEPETKAAEG